MNLGVSYIRGNFHPFWLSGLFPIHWVAQPYDIDILDLAALVNITPLPV
jgi:hypothetical protein